jgi:hypothetical protein
VSLAEGFVLTAAERRKAPSRSEEVSLEGLRQLVDDPHLGPAAKTALRCVEEQGADPRLMLLVIESAEEGIWWHSDSMDAVRERRERFNGKRR